MSNHTLERQLDLVISLLETLPERISAEVLSAFQKEASRKCISSLALEGKMFGVGGLDE